VLTGEWSIVADYEFVDLGSANAQREPFRFDLKRHSGNLEVEPAFVARLNFFDSGQGTLHGVTTSLANHELRSPTTFWCVNT